MRTLWRRLLTVITLGAPFQAAEGQRLAPTFPVADATTFVASPAFPNLHAGLQYQRRACRLHPALRIALGGLGGAAAGWLAYELTLGIWVSAEGATPDATVRRIRTEAVAAGAILGTVRAVQMSSQCR